MPPAATISTKGFIEAKPSIAGRQRQTVGDLLQGLNELLQFGKVEVGYRPAGGPLVLPLDDVIALARQRLRVTGAAVIRRPGEHIYIMLAVLVDECRHGPACHVV